MLVLVIGITGLALVYTGPVPTVAALGEWNDKALHAGAFALPALLVVLPAPAPRALLALAICAGVLELVQLAFPTRQANLEDYAASVAGLAGGSGLGTLLRHIVNWLAGWRR